MILFLKKRQIDILVKENTIKLWNFIPKLLKLIKKIMFIIQTDLELMLKLDNIKKPLMMLQNAFNFNPDLLKDLSEKPWLYII